MPSPIKTVITNLSNNVVRYNLGKQRYVHLLASGRKEDTAIVEGDIFSLFHDIRESEQLIHGVVNGTVKIHYIIESTYSVEDTDSCQLIASGSINGRYSKWFNAMVEARKEQKKDSAEEICGQDNSETATVSDSGEYLGETTGDSNNQVTEEEENVTEAAMGTTEELPVSNEEDNEYSQAEEQSVTDTDTDTTKAGEGVVVNEPVPTGTEESVDDRRKKKTSRKLKAQ